MKAWHKAKEQRLSWQMLMAVKLADGKTVEVAASQMPKRMGRATKNLIVHGSMFRKQPSPLLLALIERSKRA